MTLRARSAVLAACAALLALWVLVAVVIGAVHGHAAAPLSGTGTDRFGTSYERFAAVPDPDPALIALRGTWHRLGTAAGSVSVPLSGRPGPYFQLGVVAFARRAGRLEILTSRGQRAIVGVPAGVGTPVVLGPLAAGSGGRMGISVRSIARRSAGPGPGIVLSPMQATYLAAGQGLTRMPALAEPGPSGLRGLPLPAGTGGVLHTAPGIHGRSVVRFQAAASPEPIRVVVTMAGVTRASVLRPGRRALVVGPFPRARQAFSIALRAGPNSHTSLLLAGFRVEAIRSAAALPP